MVYSTIECLFFCEVKMIVIREGLNSQTAEPALSTDPRLNLAQVSMVFRLPQSDARRTVYFENLADPVEGRAVAAGSVPITPEIQDFIASLGSRTFLLSGGHCVIAASARPALEAYADYLIDQRLVSGDAKNNVVYVEDPTQTLAVLQFLARERLRAVPYIQRSRFYELAREAGAEILGSGFDVAVETVEPFYNKVLYRDWVRDRCGTAALPLPRVSIRPDGAAISEADLQPLIQYAEAYGRDASEGPITAMFLQNGVTGGGMGNSRVLLEATGEISVVNSFGNKESFSSWSEFVTYLNNLRQQGYFDLTPYVEVEKSYTLCMNITDQGATVIGPVDQILRAGANDYLGWQVNCGGSPAYHDLDSQIEYALIYARELHKRGYRGWSDEDIFEFRAPDGTRQAARSESNIRRDAMTHLIGVLLLHPTLAPEFTAGKVSVAHEEHIAISIPTDGSKFDARNVAQILRERGIPLVHWDEPYGALLMSAPLVNREKGQAVASLAFIARSDFERDSWRDRMKVGPAH